MGANKGSVTPSRHGAVRLAVALLAVALTAMACTSEIPETSAPAVTVAPAPTYTPLPTYTPYPTYTPVPTTTPEPTLAPTPTPTWTPEPSAPTPMPTASEMDRAALIALYEATGGPSWRNNANWATEAPLHQWYGVTANSDGRVIELSLQENGLRGELPAELGDLSELLNLRMWSNELTGEIPSELARLTDLEQFAVGGNRLRGTIPGWLADFRNLEELHLSTNRFTGTLPSWLGDLPLRRLILGNNRFDGDIPEELGKLRNLRALWLGGNDLTGCIPDVLRDVPDNDFVASGIPVCGDVAGVSVPKVTPMPTPTLVPPPAWTGTRWPALPPLDASVADPPIPYDSLRDAHQLKSDFHERYEQIENLPWVADGVVRSEKRTVEGLINVAMHGGDYFSDLMVNSWVAEGRNRPAMETLGTMARRFWSDFQRVMEHPTISNGITDREAKIIATLISGSRHDHSLFDRLLRSDGVTLEDGRVTLPFGEEVQLTIVRTRPGAVRSMDLFEQSVVDWAEFMAAPFPRSELIYLIDEGTPGGGGGSNQFTHVISLPRFDDPHHERYSEAETHRHMVHEVGHYYWRGSVHWIGEGAATFGEEIVESFTTGRPLVMDHPPCPYANSISELETLDPQFGAPEFVCHYRLGERLFHDLYRNTDLETFRLGFRRFYMMSMLNDPNDGCRRDSQSVCRLRRAFVPDENVEAREVVDTIIARWYDGTADYDLSHLDARAVDPALVSIKGRIADAFVSLDQDWPVDENSRRDKVSIAELKELGGRIFLYYRLSFPARSEPTELMLEIVEYHEDGFPFRRRVDTMRFEPGYDRGGWRTRLGLSDPAQWRPGRYGVYTYDEGRKVAHVEYEVTP